MPPSSIPEDEIIELSCRYQQLEITVKGPASQATKFLASVTSGSFAGRVPSPGPSEFEVVDNPGLASSSGRGEHRAQIEASFQPCPPELLGQANRLSGGNLSPEGRVRRAWTAGQWAKAVKNGRAHSPNRAPVLDLRSRFYAVVRCDNLSVPCIFKSSGSYWQVIGSLANSTSISHSFPSELEARTYLEGAGIEHFEVQP
eukprot:Skav202552  [mRNA]  locus=scaffold2011:394801:395400:- [translate_table: standard]